MRPYILHVDDDESLTALVEIVLKPVAKDFDCDLKCFNKSSEAFEFYRLNYDSCRLVITDLNMPIMNGYELATNINKINSKTPILYATSDTDNDLLKGIERRMIIGKPFDFSNLKQLVIKNLESKLL